MKTIMTLFAALAMSGGLAFAQDGCCGDDAKAKPAANKTAKAADGCCGDKKAAPAKVAVKDGCEGKTGCDADTKTAKAVKKTQAPLSARITTLKAKAAKGCKSSQTLLASLKGDCKTDCGDELVAKVTALEAAAAKGCDKSKKQLLALEASFKPKLTLSASLAKWTRGADKGCKTSQASLEVVKKQLKTECLKTAGAKIASLEAAAAKGCKTSAKELETLTTALKASAKVKVASKKAAPAKAKAAGCDGCEKGAKKRPVAEF